MTKKIFSLKKFINCLIEEDIPDYLFVEYVTWAIEHEGLTKEEMYALNCLAIDKWMVEIDEEKSQENYIIDMTNYFKQNPKERIKFEESLVKAVKEELLETPPRQNETKATHRPVRIGDSKSNSELQEIKRNWNNLEREYKNKIREVEDEKESVIRNAGNISR